MNCAYKMELGALEADLNFLSVILFAIHFFSAITLADCDLSALLGPASTVLICL